MQVNGSSLMDTTPALRLQSSDFRKLSPETAKAHAERAERARQQEAAELEAHKQEKRAKMLQTSEAPSRLVKSLDGLDDGEWLVRLTSLQMKLSTGFLFGLIGINGTGKSQMGVALIAKAIDLGMASRFIHAPELMDSIKDVYRADDGSTMQDRMKQFFGPKLLVIDEVNAGAMTEADVKYLHRIVCKRYDDMTDTLLISNDKRVEFQKLIGDRVVSRMIETGGIIETNWPSFRRPRL